MKCLNSTIIICIWEMCMLILQNDYLIYTTWCYCINLWLSLVYSFCFSPYRLWKLLSMFATLKFSYYLQYKALALHLVVLILAVQNILYLEHEGGPCLVVIGSCLENMQMAWSFQGPLAVCALVILVFSFHIFLSAFLGMTIIHDHVKSDSYLQVFPGAGW